MRAYLAISGLIFAAIVVAHITRIVVESSVAGEPHFVLLTLASALLALWAGRLLWKSRRRV
jgi:hypothetical protein